MLYVWQHKLELNKLNNFTTESTENYDGEEAIMRILTIDANEDKNDV